MKKTLVFPLIFLLVIAISACSDDVNVGNDGTAKSSSASKTESGNNSSAKKESIHKQVKLNFSNTSVQQTTKVDSAEIKDVSDLNITDDNFDSVKYVLLIHMSVTNQAPQSAETYPSQGHVVMDDGAQIDGIIGADVNVKDAFKDGDVASGATKSGYVLFPLTEEQAEKFKKAAFKFDVTAGDEIFTQKNYRVDINF